MITLPTSSIKPAIVYDGVWITNVLIASPNPNRTVSAYITCAPYSSTVSDIDDTKRLNIPIDDVFLAASSDPNVAGAMGSIFNYVQSKFSDGTYSFNPPSTSPDSNDTGSNDATS